MPHDPKACLLDALHAACDIREFCSSLTVQDYASNKLVRAAVEREFEIIGEALNRLHKADPALLARITDYKRIIGFRNVLAHGYDAIVDLAVWQIVEEKLPNLIEELQALLAVDS